MTDDRSLLEAAARAAGATYTGWHEHGLLASWPGMTIASAVLWNPLEHDGDESRLEATLRLTVRWHETFVVVGNTLELYRNNGDDRQAARRRAGVRAAAAIGRAS